MFNLWQAPAATCCTTMPASTNAITLRGLYKFVRHLTFVPENPPSHLPRAIQTVAMTKHSVCTFAPTPDLHGHWRMGSKRNERRNEWCARTNFAVCRDGQAVAKPSSQMRYHGW